MSIMPSVFFFLINFFSIIFFSFVLSLSSSFFRAHSLASNAALLTSHNREKK
ncbi:hypothetical protein RchiOBHm_Chr7g0203011 [Rosa chinensis]|uniref:Uncharacterized protein n=1 Tax=Rosa chinensis TaxID=74649 RepID=A0A2P6P8C2_ROSCH|nr:hypothetical protein RchiOBHm_Chr7g0203011 [Rosa chinensis]